MEHLYEFNEFGGTVSKELQELLTDILLEISDEGYDVTKQWFTTQDNLPYIMIEREGGMDYKSDVLKDVIERVNTVTRDYGWRLDVDAGARYYMLIFI